MATTTRPYQSEMVFQSYSKNNTHLVNPDGTAWCNSRIQGWTYTTSVDRVAHGIDCGRCARRAAQGGEHVERTDTDGTAPADRGECCGGCGRTDGTHWTECPIGSGR